MSNVTADSGTSYPDGSEVVTWALVVGIICSILLLAGIVVMFLW